MNSEESLARIARSLDATLLAPEATWTQLKAFMSAAEEINAYGVCILPKFVPAVHRWVEETNSSMKIISVIGFPTGGDLVGVKNWETVLLASRVHEYDYVPNLGNLAETNWGEFAKEIRHFKSASTSMGGVEITKVILETALLETKQIETAVKICIDQGIDYVKTSTGVHPAGGASVAAVETMLAVADGKIKVKASGGISTPEQALEYLDLGVHRIGAAKLVSQISQARLETGHGNY